jgi:hypothetical protein
MMMMMMMMMVMTTVTHFLSVSLMTSSLAICSLAATAIMSSPSTSIRAPIDVCVICARHCTALMSMVLARSLGMQHQVIWYVASAAIAIRTEVYHKLALHLHPRPHRRVRDLRHTLRV